MKHTALETSLVAKVVFEFYRWMDTQSDEHCVDVSNEDLLNAFALHLLES
jgi:hypothetical protein